MSKQRILTGITTTGTPHLGNYVGAIKPAIAASQSDDVDSFLFLADYHALIKSQEPEKIRQSSREIAATWLALGLDTDRVTFYRQSDVPEIMELAWILTCWTAKGLMNRAHAPGNSFTFLMAGVATDYTEIMSIRDTTKSWRIALFLPLVTVPQVMLIGAVLNQV